MIIKMITNPFQYFTDNNGEPLESGLIYIGEAGLNPEANPITIFWDRDFLYPAAQPIRTINGIPARGGTPSAIYTPETDYSILVRNKNQEIIYSVLTSSEGVVVEFIDETSSQTLENKTLVLPWIADASGNNTYRVAVNALTTSRTITLPLLTTDDEIVFKDHPVTLKNKILEEAVLDTSVSGTAFQNDAAFASAAPDKFSSSEAIKLFVESKSTKNIRDLSRELVIIPNAVNPLYQIDIDAAEVSTQDSSQSIVLLENVNLTVDITVSGVNGLDTGSEATDAWYYLWVIAKADGTAAGLLSASSTAPTMPATYTFKALVGAVRNDGSSDFIPFSQEDNKVLFNAVQTVKDGSFTASAWTSQSITAFAPTTAKTVQFVGGNNTVAGLGLSTRSDGHAGSYAFENNFAGISGTAFDVGGVFPTARQNWMELSVRYADTLYYYIFDSNSTLVILGWEY